MSNIVTAENVAFENGLTLPDVIRLLGKDIDYLRYLPISMYSIEIPPYTVDTTLGDNYQTINGITVTPLTNHAKHIFEISEEDPNAIALYRYISYIFITQTRVTGTKQNKTATGAEIGLRWRIGTLDDGTNLDSGYHSINVATQYNRFSYTFSDILISKAGSSYRNQDTVIFPRYLNSEKDLDLQYGYTKGLVIAIQENAIV